MGRRAQEKERLEVSTATRIDGRSSIRESAGKVSMVHKREVFAAVMDNQEGDSYEVRVIGFDKPGNAGLGGGKLPNKFSRSYILLPRTGRLSW
jgi:hypothetical protein